MSQLEIWQTINQAVHDALVDGAYRLSERDLLARADELLERMPTAGGTRLTGALLLRRYHHPLQKELCRGGAPIPLPDVIEDEVRELTRVVLVAADVGEGFSVDVAVLLALAIRAGGIARYCGEPVSTFTV